MQLSMRLENHNSSNLSWNRAKKNVDVGLLIYIFLSQNSTCVSSVDSDRNCDVKKVTRRNIYVRTENNQLDRLAVFARGVIDAQRVFAGIFTRGFYQREVRVILLVADRDALCVGQRDVVAPDPCDVRWRFAGDVHRPFVCATHFDGHGLQRAAIDARLHCFKISIIQSFCHI